MTIKDIAKLSGVSIATVSMIVNKKDDRISEDTRTRVLQFIKDNGYILNRVVGPMVTKVTNTIGLILLDVSNPF